MTNPNGGHAPSDPTVPYRLTSSRSKLLRIAAVLFIAAANALLLFVLVPKVRGPFMRSYTMDRYDGDGYDQIAENLADGNGYRLYPNMAETLVREPGYPILLAGLYKTVGRSLRAVQFVNLIFALATAWLITRIASQLSSSRLLIFGSPLLFLLHPETLLAESRGGIEILFGFMLALFILTVLRAVKTNRWRDYLVSGAVLGLTCLVRSTPILFPVFLLGYVLAFDRRRHSAVAIVRNFALMAAAMFVVLSPWIVRNYKLTGKFVPTASVLGVAAQAGLYHSAHHALGYVVADTEAGRQRNRLAQRFGFQFRPGYYQYFYSSADELAFSRDLFDRVVRRYESSPLLLVRTVLDNAFFNFWCGAKTRISALMDAVVQLPFVALALVGLVICLRAGRARETVPMALLVVYIVAVSTPILAQARYSAPLTPFLSILVCSAFAAWLGELVGARHAPANAVALDEQEPDEERREPVAAAWIGRPI